ncbi:MAG TPA: hypothetical protein VHC22_20950 [Pirellulales bacterium]|nr:hypothetical protein [Pirellulales bacterium]
MRVLKVGEPTTGRGVIAIEGFRIEGQWRRTLRPSGGETFTVDLDEELPAEQDKALRLAADENRPLSVTFGDLPPVSVYVRFEPFGFQTKKPRPRV